MCFPVNFEKFLRAPFLLNISERLLLPFKKLQYNIFQNEMLGWINIIFYVSSKNKWCLLKAKVSNLYEVK